MTQLTIADRNLNKNTSVVSEETLLQWAEAMEDAVASVIDNDEDDVQLRTDFTLDTPVRYDEEENRLVGYVVDASGEQWSFALFLDPDGVYGIYSGNDATFFELVVAEEIHEGDFITLVQHDAYHGEHDIREGLADLMMECLG